MATKNKNRGQTHAPTGSNSSPPVVEPTPHQVNRLSGFEGLAAAMSAEHGTPLAPAEAESVLPTLEACLKRVEGLLNEAQSHRQAALSAKGENEAERKRLVEQKSMQERNYSDRKKELEADRKALEADQQALKEAKLALAAKEAKITESSIRLTEREFNAEQGFIAEKVRILLPVEDEIKRLREERDILDSEIAEAREKAEDDLRAKSRARAERWAAEDDKRSESEAEARRQFDEKMSYERQEKWDALRVLLASERDNAEALWQTERDRRTAVLEQQAHSLGERESTLNDRLSAHQHAAHELRAEQEMLEEDQAALARKVERLVAEGTEKIRHQVDALEKQLGDARAQRDAYFRDIESRRELDRRFGGRAPEEILAALTDAERQRDALTQQLRERPAAQAGERLAELERQRSAWLEERAVLQGDLAKAHGELATRRLAAIELESQRKQKEALEVHKQLLDGAVDELRARVDELTRQEDHRNPMTALTSLDDQEQFQAEVRTTSPLGRATPTLKAFADDLRHRIANGVEGRTLYYAERDVRAFIGGLAMTRLMLLQGISGTGKTSLPLAFASAVGGGIEVIEVQAGWRDRQDLIGYYNAFHRHYYATNFLQALYRAGTPAYRDRVFMMVLDEMNLSRPEQFFADFLSALEQSMDKRRLTLVNDPVTNAPRLMVDGRHLPIPPNVWFVGTANHDESTAEFADKTYDRAHVMEMPRNTDEARFEVQSRSPRSALSYEKLEAVFKDAANAQEKSVHKAVAWLRSAPFADELQKRFRVGWGNRLENQLARYLPVVVESGGSIGEAMDHLLVTKVLRKLKDRHDVRAAALEDLSTKLQTAWEKLDMANPPQRCVELIELEIAAKKGEEQE
jgi:hypothetical protein